MTEWLQKARAHLRNADPVLARLIADRPDFDPRQWMTELPRMKLFGALLFQIAGQQLSVIAEKWRPYRSLVTAYLFSVAFDEAQGARALAGDHQDPVMTSHLSRGEPGPVAKPRTRARAIREKP